MGEWLGMYRVLFWPGGVWSDSYDQIALVKCG